VTKPFQSSQELATQAAKQLTHALLHPQPPGPFLQVGDEQMLALERLSAIFEGGLPLHKINDYDAPPSRNRRYRHTSKRANYSFHPGGCQMQQHLQG
jgi:hypothetical protein